MTHFIDTNVTLSRWPFRRLRGDDTVELVKILRHHGVTQAWAGTFDGVLHKDIASANERLVHECRQHGHGILLPFGTVNIMLPAWEEDVRRCVEEHKMRGLRVFPNYHGYKLDHPDFARLLAMCDEHRLILQLAVSIEDERTQHPLLQVTDVDAAPLAGLLKLHPRLRVVILNSLRGTGTRNLNHLSACKNVSFDIATREGVEGLKTLAEKISVDRVLFGSHAPFFYFESAVLKLRESGLGEEQLARIRTKNAEALLLG
ncbi:MAG: putative TIM-barrel fold metal-dependent hydrolase [Verrucomicrobiales bacterium]|nr:putative TIM-barrel fold metal-dependent hydrolase [Verrucomicrobiales bacterium]